MSAAVSVTAPAHRRPAGGLVNAVFDTVDVAGRNLRSLARSPQALIFATVQPMIFVLLFRYAFGGAIKIPGVSYVDFLMPGSSRSRSPSVPSARRSGCRLISAPGC
jgi:ABC-2 type transport system permease protein/oleandomycin transport system permease protein